MQGGRPGSTLRVTRGWKLRDEAISGCCGPIGARLLRSVRNDSSYSMTLLTLLNARDLRDLLGGRVVGQRDRGSAAARQARSSPAGFALRDRHRRLSYAGPDHRRRPAGEGIWPARACGRGSGLRCGCPAVSRPRSRSSPARATAMCAAPRCIAITRVAEIVGLVDRMRAAALIAQPGYGADADRHDLFRPLADRDFLRETACGGSDLWTRLPFAGFAGPVARVCRRATMPTRSCTCGFYLGHHRRAERRVAQRQHAARHRPHDGARLAVWQARCSTR